MGDFKQSMASVLRKYGSRYMARGDWSHVRCRFFCSRPRRCAARVYDRYVDLVETAKSRVGLSRIGWSSAQLAAYEYLWGRLDSDSDKALLEDVVALRVLGHNAFYFKRNMETFGKVYRLIEKHGKHIRGTEYVSVNLGDIMSDLGRIDVEVSPFVLASYVCGQYQHEAISPRLGDFCIDFGAFMGETSLLMAEKVGDGGKVFAVEFGSSQLGALNRNLGRNATLASRVEVWDRPFWSESNVGVYVSGQGGTTAISFTPLSNSNTERLETLSLDEAVEVYRVNKLDFIKMDVEGAEYPILKGGVNCLRRFKPKLAISIYHSDEDFDRIPRLVDSLGCGYKFSIGHYSPFFPETVLYASVSR